MRAMLLCAGAGSRLRPRTHVLPKPLASAGGVPLAVRQLRALARAGVRDIVVNAAHGAAELVHALGGGERWNVRLRYSIEGKSALEALETRGGIVRALDLLTDEGREDAFIAVAGDIVTDFDFARLLRHAWADDALAHLVMVENPDYHPQGDMGLCADGRLSRVEGERLTFSSLGLYKAELFSGLDDRRASLFPWLFAHVDAGRVTGERFEGLWANVGTELERSRVEALLREDA